jgi:heme exporter protein C
VTSQLNPPASAPAVTTTTATATATSAGETARGWVSTGSRKTRILGIVCLAGAALWVFLGLVGTPPDEVQGEAVRLMYLHVPVVSVAYMASFLAAFASGMWLWKRTQGWDLLAVSAVEVSALFVGGTLVSGAIWGGASWGVFWVWDARLTSTALLFLLQLGYLAVRRVPATAEVRGKRSAILGLLLVPNIIVINQSVTWWQSVHQDATMFRASLSPKLHDLMAFTFIYSMVFALLVFVWLMIHRFRVAYLEDRVDEIGLERAVADRRAEALP